MSMPDAEWDGGAMPKNIDARMIKIDITASRPKSENRLILFTPVLVENTV
jgi:hypothetical protein